MRWFVLGYPLIFPSLALAQAPAPAGPTLDTRAFTGQPPPTATPATPRAPEAPPARTGFQMHFVPLTAIAFPFGDATGARRDTLSGRYSWQWVPLEVGLGAKIIDELYVGAYLSLGVGYEGSDSRVSARCEAGNDVEDDVSCNSVTVHAGIEARYNFAPADSMNGWIGYGFGMSSANQTISDSGRYRESTTARGLDLARLSGGLDFRVKRGFGLGPFGIVSVGRYLHTRTEIRDDVTFSGDIENKATHAWVMLGLRMVIFP